MSMLRIPYEDVHALLLTILLKAGFEIERARLCARLFAETSLDGVYSHGLNRFPRFMQTIKNSVVDIHARPELMASFGVLERWDGRGGPGNLNAYECMDRAISLSRKHGMGAVALANTNHWLRAGSYGWQAADAGVIGVCWTNTMPNLPPWGSSEPRLGNNPLVIAVPRAEGNVVLDMAMSQFSYGTLESYRMRGEQLPVAGGFDLSGDLTRDPGAIEASVRPLPIGYWKGSGLALMLDLVAALLAGGNATYQVTQDSFKETQLSQVFLAFDMAAIENESDRENVTNQIVESVRTAKPSGDQKVRYPGERTLEIRRQNLQDGIPIDPGVWQAVRELAG
jgi:3-dehydro-L-gulonate 2-dehydrogenase